MVDKMEDKINGLLAKAERTDNEHERVAYQEAAERLMLKYQIDRATLEAKAAAKGEAKTEDIIIHKETMTGAYPRAYVRIAHSVNNGLGNVRTFLQARGKEQVVWFVGHESDIKDALRLFESLKAQGMHQMTVWWRHQGSKELYYRPADKNLARRQFLLSFAQGVETQLVESRRVVVEESAPGTSLVLVDRSKQVDMWVGSNMQTGKARGRGLAGGGSSARSAGYTAGKNASTRKSIG